MSEWKTKRVSCIGIIANFGAQILPRTISAPTEKGEKMAEYIEREAVLALKQKIGAYGMDISSQEVMLLPTADVAPVVHGEWVPFHSEAAGNIQYCSACDVGFAHRTDFCPHCGADMRERKGDDD